MSKFNPNDRVIVIDEDENVTKGEIQTDYESLGIAIVKLDDGSIKKVNYRNVYRDPEPTAKAVEDVADEPDEEKKLPEGAKVISKEQFLEAIHTIEKARLTSKPSGFLDMILCPVITASSVQLSRKLAEDIFANESEVILTADELTLLVWEKCDPRVIHEDTGHIVPIADALTIGAQGVDFLHDVIMKLFVLGDLK